MQLNASLYSKGRVVYGTIIQFDDLPQWEDKHTVDLAFKAHEAVEEQFDEDQQDQKTYRGMTRKQLPVVTTTLVVENTAYIFTSMKGGSYLYDPGDLEAQKHGQDVDLPADHPCRHAGGEVFEALRRCQMQAVDTAGSNVQRRAHRTGASCGKRSSLSTLRPISASWDMRLRHYHCLRRNARPS